MVGGAIAAFPNLFFTFFTNALRASTLLLNFIFARSFRIGTLSSSSFFRLSMHGVANLASIST
jgi:hypothetical protein